MTVFQGILLGILQGIAEFLPISSSGHLAVAQNLFKLDDVPLLFDVFLHLATLLAVCLYFWRKIARLFCILGRWIVRRTQLESTVHPEDLLAGTDKAGRRTIVAVIITTFITAVIGIFTSKKMPELSIKSTCAGFLVTAVLLIVSNLKRQQNEAKAEKEGRKFKEVWKEHEEEKAKAAAKKAEEEKANAPKPDDILLLEQIKAELVKLNGKK